MIRVIKKLKLPAALFMALCILPITLGTCNNSLGFGPPVDLEPPELWLDPTPSPLFANASRIISGTARDNVGVVRVVAREQISGRILGSLSFPGLREVRWSMQLDFDGFEDGTRIVVDFTAFDHAGNSGEGDTQSLAIIIDKSPPTFGSVTIWRSDTRFAELHPLEYLRRLHRELDPFLNNPQFVDYYQNGVFRIHAEVMDRETSILPESTRLVIFALDADGNDLGEVFYRVPPPESHSPFSPFWIVSENDLIDGARRLADELALQGRDIHNLRRYEEILAGNGQQSPEYGRLFFRVRVIAYDFARNREVGDEFGYFLLSRLADAPRIVTGADIRVLGLNAAIPMDIFDDDSLDWVYVDLMTRDQFRNIGPALTAQERLEVIRQRLENGIPVPTWKADPAYVNTVGGDASSVFTNRRTGTTYPGSLNFNVFVGTDASHHGDFVLVAIVKDKKLPPHAEYIPGSTDPFVQLSRPSWTVWHREVTVADRNAPLIVIDTTDGDGSSHLAPHLQTGHSPEENTFPKLDVRRNAQGEITHAFFELNGFTLDDDSNSRGRVDEFKIAWIPFRGIPGWQEEVLQDVKDHLSAPEENPLTVPGVQIWDLRERNTAAHSSQYSFFEDAGTEQIAGITYRRQVFRKRFDILGGFDDIHTTTRNFHYNGELENDPKLFVLYARDIDGNVTYRVIRILGNRSMPRLNIYNLTERARQAGLTDPGQTQAQQNTMYNAIRALPRSIEDRITEASTFYPPGTTLVLLIQANEEGGLPISSITMRDRVEDSIVGSDFNGGNIANIEDGIITYITQLTAENPVRMLQFEVVNALDIGRDRFIERTIAVTNTAVLERITTEQVAGTYPGGTEIVFRAHFSNQVFLTRPAGSTAVPLLNIRYRRNIPGTTNFEWGYVRVPMVQFTGNRSTESTVLEFRWTVPANALGRLETAVGSITDGWPATHQWPLYVPGAVSIWDGTRDNLHAFLPGTHTIPWGLSHSLQGDRIVLLDGIAPLVNTVTGGGKTPFSADTFYFRAGETIEFTLQIRDQSSIKGAANNRIIPGLGTSSNQAIANLQNPRIEFRVREILGSAAGPVPGNLIGGNADPTSFFANYLRPQGAAGMVFSFREGTDATINFPAGGPMAGRIEIVGINTVQGTITDPVGNNLAGNFAEALTSSIFIDKRAPGTMTPIITPEGETVPAALAATPPGADPIMNLFNGQPVLTIAEGDHWSVEPWPTAMEYSMGGNVWLRFPEARPGWTTQRIENGVVTGLYLSSGIHRLQTRQVDRAGNTGASNVYHLDIKGEFPQITTIRSTNPAGIYTPAWFIPHNRSIRIILDFRHNVHVRNTAQTYIIVTDTLNPAVHNASTPDSVLNSSNVARIFASQTPAEGSSYIEFNWVPVMKEMDGIRVSYIHLAGVEDIYGNSGAGAISTSAPPFTGDPPNRPLGSIPSLVRMDHPTAPDGEPNYYYRTNLNGFGIRVFTIPPQLLSMTPVSAHGNIRNQAAVLGGDRRTITMTFNSQMQIGMGTITIRPRECDGPGGNGIVCAPGMHTAACHNMIPIPPVFPAEGFYLWPCGTESPRQNAARTGVYIHSFHEIYNSLVSDADRRILLRGPDTRGHPAEPALQRETGTGNFDDPTLDARTGQWVGPYRFTTQGLRAGAGFTAHAHTNTQSTMRWDASNNRFFIHPNNDNHVTNPGWWTEDGGADPFMIPDIRGKFVLDPQFGITEDIWSYYNALGNPVNTAVNRGAVHPAGELTVWNYHTAGNPARRQVILDIRNALSRARFRWHEIEVTSHQISFSPDRRTVTITLDNPLPKGMRWDVIWDQGALENLAGIPVALPENWWFWTDGVQAPVIRVNRQSIDNRNVVAMTNENGGVFWHSVPPGTAGTIGAATMTNLNNVLFRFESETPGALLSFAEIRGALNDRAAQMAWTGTVNDITWPNTWNATHATFPQPVANYIGTRAADPGTWIQPNLLRRSIRGGRSGTTVIDGMTFRDRTGGAGEPIIEHQGMGNLRMIRSFNRDVRRSELTGPLSFTAAPTSRSSNFTFSAAERLTASKNYVVAEAARPHGGAAANPLPSTARGFEGIFRTVVAIAQGDERSNFLWDQSTNQWLGIGGSNSPDGSTSIPGFPMLMGTGDLRYFRIMALDPGNTQRVWISTEIVSPAYFRFVSRNDGASLMSQPWTLMGDVGQFVSGGFGELTYVYGMHRD